MHNLRAGLFWVALSLLPLTAGAAELKIEITTSTPTETSHEDILKAIYYGDTPLDDQINEAKESTVFGDKSCRNSVGGVPSVLSTGEIRVKLAKGFSISKKDHVTQVSKDSSVIYPDALYFLDYEFPNAEITPLWGDPKILLQLKERGEKLTGRKLPDLSLWVSINPDPSFPIQKVFDEEGFLSHRLSDIDGKIIDRAIEILRAIPGIEMVSATPPMILSSYPDYTTPPGTDWTNYMLQAAPDIYLTDGDYDGHTLAIADLLNQHSPNGVADSHHSPISCNSNSTCKTGGLNIWPAWDKAYKGESVRIGYMESGWQLDPPNDGDIDPENTHPDFLNLRNNHLAYLTQDNRDLWKWHGTPVLGIMAADESPSSKGGMGVSPNSTYFIGQIWEPQEWITVSEKLIASPQQGNGSVLLLEAALGCFTEDFALGAQNPCPVEVWPEFNDFIKTVTANGIVVVTIPGNGIGLGGKTYAAVALDDPRNFTVDGDLEAVDFDSEIDSGEWDFEYPDGDIDWDYQTPYPSSVRTLNRGSNQFSDTGSILVAAGFSSDLLSFSMRARTQWSSYGSRVDVQGRHNSTLTTVLGGGYGFFSGTSSCGPLVAGVAALSQQMYKTIHQDDFLSSVRMRNALVENGNAQILNSVDPAVTLHEQFPTAYSQIPEFLVSTQEPFARIGPRPDVGNIQYAFGLENHTYTPAPTAATDINIRYHLPFDNHQFKTVFKPYRIINGVVGPVYFPVPVMDFIPSEPFALNYLDRVWNSSGVDNGSITLVASPRIGGGHAVMITPPAYYRIQEDEINGGIDIFHPHRDASNIYTVPASSSNNITLSAWVNILTSSGNQQNIFYKGTPGGQTEYGMYINSAMNLCFSVTDGTQVLRSICSATTLQLNRVYYLAAIVSQEAIRLSTPYYTYTGPGTVIRLYEDGQFAKSLAFANTSIAQYSTMPSVGYNFSGIIDDVLFEDYALPIDRGMFGTGTACPTLKSRFANGANPNGLISSWHFTEKDADPVSDPVSRIPADLNSTTGFYTQWGAGMPIGGFDSTQTLLVSESAKLPGNPNYAAASFSVESHFRTPKSDGMRYLVTRGAGSTSPATSSWTILWQSGGVFFRVCTTSLCKQIQSTVVADRWTHLVATYAKSGNTYTLSMFVNGNISQPITQTFSDSANLQTLTSPVLIGGRTGGSAYDNWNAPVEYVRLYSTALTSATRANSAPAVDDITFLYNNRASLWRNSYYKNK